MGNAHPTLAVNNSIHLDLDGAWNPRDLPIETLDLSGLGPRLRYCASGRGLRELEIALPGDLPRFILCGSGDFHYLSGLWVRRAVASGGGGVTLICFDNHPDWDIRPPRWSCGGWINRAMELPEIREAHVWGCGNFELALPHRVFANRAALRSGRLHVHPWAERYDRAVQKRFDCIWRRNWREEFARFAEGLGGGGVYISVDLDCLVASEARTNWENGLFTASEVAWAIGVVREHATVLGGDMCGGYSPLVSEGAFRRLAVWWDHPKLPPVSLYDARQINLAAFSTIWPALANSV